MATSTNDVSSVVKMGRSDIAFTPAFWVEQANRYSSSVKQTTHRLGNSLKEESVACLLGGYGIPAEVGLGAFQILRDANILDKPNVDFESVFAILSSPLNINGRSIRYRFASQKSRYIADFLNSFQNMPQYYCYRELRQWFTRFNGIGLKTASWIVRNWFSADDVAILDIHIHRAGLLTGFFSHSQTVAKDYLEMEQQFVSFSESLGIRASVLDATIWSQMRMAPRLVKACISA